jgi:hypothetical protein
MFCSVGVTLIIAARSSISVVLFMVTAFTAANYSLNGLFPYFMYPTEQNSVAFTNFKAF